MTAPVVAGVLSVPIADLVHGPNARGELGDVTDLANSLRAIGQQQPLLVEPREDGKWSVFDGNRRLKAARLAGFAYVLAIPRKTPLTEQQRLLRQLGMHATGKAFDPMAEARAVDWLMFHDEGPHMSREDIARVLSKSPAWVKGRVDLLRLAPDEQESVAAGTLSVGAALQTVAQRRSGSTAPRTAPAASAEVRHCPSCTCDQRSRS